MTAVTFNDTSDQVICAGIDNTVKIYDRRTKKVNKISCFSYFGYLNS